MRLNLQSMSRHFHPQYINAELAHQVNEAIEESKIDLYINDAMEELKQEGMFK